MTSLTMSLISFSCVFGGALVGLGLRAVLPAHHRDSESKDLVKMGLGFVGTMSALLLGLLVASTKASYDLQKSEMTELSSKIVFIDRILAHYGSEADQPRARLREAVSRMIDQIWPPEDGKAAQLDPALAGAEGIFEQIEALVPTTEPQRALKAQALAAGAEISKLRWHIFQQSGGSSVSRPLMVMVVGWLTIIFIGYGFCAPRNATVIVTLFLCVLSVSSALFLILEMDRPFGGIIHISPDAMRNALAHLGQGL
jgi:hypothetical protein